jgi:hypothetical protein
MSKRISWILALSIAVGVAGCAQPVVTTQTVMVDGVGPVEIERLDVEVVAVDPPSRTVVVRQRGFSWLVDVPPLFGNLQNIQPGDRLEIRRVEGAVLSARRARKGARPSITYTEAVSGPPFHNLPDKFIVRSLTLTAKFEKFDPASGVVNYVGPAGPRTHTVVDAGVQADLRRLRRGDMVDLTFAEAFHIMKTN